MVFPSSYLAPESQDWVRTAERKITDLERGMERALQNEFATNQAQNSSMNLLTERLGNLEGSLVEAFARMTINAGQITAGTIAQARIPRSLPGALNVGSLGVEGGISAGGGLSAGSVTTPTLTVNGDAGVNGNLYLPNSSLASSGYTVAYINGDGRVTRGASSERFKRDIAAWSPDVQAIFAMRLVTFYYRDEVLNGDEPRLEVGVIAEELVALGLDWLVYTNENGEPMGVHYERIALALLPAVQDLDARVSALEELL